MNADADDGRTRRLAQVVQLVRAKAAAAQRTVVEDFIARYFRDVEAEDFAEREPADLYGAALSHWNFARRREPGRTRIRVFNPSLEEQGWQSTHTIIEIVNDDMPFLVDSVTMEVNRHGFTLHLIIHPIVEVTRGADGTLGDLVGGSAKASRRESFIHVEVDRITEPVRLEALAQDITRVLDDGRAAVEDWKAMRERVRAIVAEVRKQPPLLPTEELGEGEDFLLWLADNHFTFLGYRCHELAVVDGEDVLKIVPDRCSASCARAQARKLRRALRHCRPRFAPTPGARNCLWSPNRHRARPCTGRAISTTSPSSASTRRASSSARIAFSACSPRPPTALTRPTSRFCGARSRRSSSVPGCLPGDTPARRW